MYKSILRYSFISYEQDYKILESIDGNKIQEFIKIWSECSLNVEILKRKPSKDQVSTG